MPKKRLPLPKRFNVALTEKAYGQLRELSEKQTFVGNNYTLTILLENWEELVDRNKFEQVLKNFWAEYGNTRTTTDV